MTSHYRHRRFANPATAFPSPLEPGEIAANTALRQIAVGDAATGSAGAPLNLLAVRVFDTRATYAVGDYVTQGGQLYRCKTAVTTPGAFNAANWDVNSADPVLKAYADAGDAAVTSAYQAVDAVITTAVNNRVLKTGDTMTGMLTLPGTTPTTLQATTRQYVDNAITTATGGAGAAASGITNVPAGGISATNVQAAINELDTEKAPITSPNFLGTPTAPKPAVNDNSTKIATTQWYAGQAGASNPTMNGAQAIGISLRFSREDHVHPSDTSRAPLNSPAFTGTPTAPTPADTDNSTKIATTAFVKAMQISGDNIANGSIQFIKMASDAIATMAEFLNNTANKILTADRVWAAASYKTLADGSTIQPNFANGINFQLTMTGTNRIMDAPTGTKDGQTGCIMIRQSGGGGNTIQSWNAVYKFPSGTKPVLTTNANAVDLVSYTVVSPSLILCTFTADLK